MRRLDLIAVFLLVATHVAAQHPAWKAEVVDVRRSGMQAIQLAPELLGASRQDLGDIRLVDSTGKQLPYFLREASPSVGRGAFIPFRLIRNETLRYRSEIELERPEGVVIDELHLWIRPTEASKSARITGSDDRESWYMVKDGLLEANTPRGDPPREIRRITLPPSDYRYLRVVMNDSLTAPLQVLGVGRFDEDRLTPPCFGPALALPFEQSDSVGISRLHVALDHAVLADRLAYVVMDSTNYLREAYVEIRLPSSFTKGRREVQRYVTRRFPIGHIDSNRDDLLEPNGLRLDTFDLVVVNGDDAPLRFAKLEALPRCRFLIADLAVGMQYIVTTGAPTLETPRYDIVHFAAELSQPLDTLNHSALIAMPDEPGASPLFDTSAWWVWAAILALMAGMTFVAVRLLKQPS